ncbi:hypothetical protein [Spirillospora sp. NPDC029432]|uniref:hypothetical protein n=1 Tax=Spirillospora sp. NPDC029432 TaxID=3154599 RepID=UPI003451E36C
MQRSLTWPLALIAALITAAVLTTVPAHAAPAAPAAAGPLGTPAVTGTTADGGTFAGTLTPSRFVLNDGRMVLEGVFDGTLRDAGGATIGTVTGEPASLPVALQRECPILDLTLGPLDLDLLGLQVHLDRVVLDITAVSGPGKLLGNLLCALVGLLDSGDTAGAALLVAELNRLLELS